eukprot:6799467-Prorocentrum_lima.AAC.1
MQVSQRKAASTRTRIPHGRPLLPPGPASLIPPPTTRLDFMPPKALAALVAVAALPLPSRPLPS